MFGSIENLATVNPNDMLIDAIDLSDSNLIQEAINIGADVNFSNGKPLRWAVMTGNLPIVHKLVTLGANVNANKSDAIIRAASDGNLPIVNYLIMKGSHGLNGALVKAVARNYLNIVKRLLEVGADIDVNYNLPFLSAIFNGHKEMIKLLVSAGAEINENVLVTNSESSHPEYLQNALIQNLNKN
jgi:ankyrin repeat protein